MRIAVALGVLERDVQSLYERPARGGQVPRHVPIVVLVDRDAGRCVSRGYEADAFIHPRLPNCPLYLIGDRNELVAIIGSHLDIAGLQSPPFGRQLSAISFLRSSITNGSEAERRREVGEAFQDEVRLAGNSRTVLAR